MTIICTILEINKNVDLFVCFTLKWEQTSVTVFLIGLPNWFSLCLDIDKNFALML